ncbi:MAG: hypothetical protein M1281_08750 [Chloroflexi bacterium]|nr:hypothetical protein [Chloroflexota bacterium]
MIYILQNGIHLLGSMLYSGTLPQMGGWDYLFLMVFSVLQGPVATLLGATAAAAGIVRLEWVFLSISFGNLAVDMLWYTLGRAGKVEWLLHSSRWLKMPLDRVEILRTIVIDRSSWIMTLAKVSSGLVMPAMVATGLARVPWKRWLPTLFAAEFLRTGTLVIVGYYSARFLSEVLAGYTYFSLAASLMILIASGWFIKRKLRLQDRMEESNI